MSRTIDRFTARPTRNEVLLAFRGLVEQVRLGLHDGRRLIRRLIAASHTSTDGSTVQVTSSPTPLVSVPLVVLRPTTAREQIELHDLVQILGADGYQVAPRGPQWVVYTEIADRRKPAIGRSAQDRRRSQPRWATGVGAIVLDTRSGTPNRLHHPDRCRPEGHDVTARGCRFRVAWRTAPLQPGG